VDIQSVGLASVAGTDFIRVQSHGVPSYEVVMTQERHDALTSRPKASSDFDGGKPSVDVGATVSFGQDIGYTNQNCTLGFWPPGPECPGDAGHDAYFPVEPEEATETCWTALNAIGLFVNGAAIFNWWDGQSYQNDGRWNVVAAVAEVYDLDICGGHSAGPTYHHHNYSSCLAEQLGDDGEGHSPLYGFAADGYPVYGPWYAKGVAATPCWKTRGFDDPNSPTGCGEVGKRSCVMVDQLDPSAGTTDPAELGPDTTASYQTQSGNIISAEAGLFFEDYFYDSQCAAQGGQYLDESNGHDHDGLGYHYHISFAFPYTMGPKFHGKLHDNAMHRCFSDVAVGPGG